jgi:hypothetical protein
MPPSVTFHHELVTAVHEVPPLDSDQHKLELFYTRADFIRFKYKYWYLEGFQGLKIMAEEDQLVQQRQQMKNENDSDVTTAMPLDCSSSDGDDSTQPSKARRVAHAA